MTPELLKIEPMVANYGTTLTIAIALAIAKSTIN
jgi:hypothetical protein